MKPARSTGGWRCSRRAREFVLRVTQTRKWSANASRSFALAGGVLLLLAAANTPALAQQRSTSAALIEAGDSALRDDLQWLIDRGVIDFSAASWPIAKAALADALANRRTSGLSAADQAALRSVQRTLALDDANFGLELSAGNRAAPRQGFESTALARGEASAYVQGESGRLAGKLKVNGLHAPLTDKQSSVTWDGSYVSAELLGQLVYAGQLERWWGPGHDQSLIWSNAAPSIPGLGVRRAGEQAPRTEWLSWIGPWGYDVFVGRLPHYTSNPGARLFAARLYARPIQGLEIGASRLIQWGSGDSGVGALGDALLGRANDPTRPANNEAAGFDLRYRLLVAGNPLALYGQLVGEDEAGLWPSKYTGLLGAGYGHSWMGARLQWHAEAADTKASRLFRGTAAGIGRVAYRHSRYRDGLYVDGLPIGAGIGGDGRIYSAGVSVAPDGSASDLRYSLKLMQAAVNESAFGGNMAYAEPGDFRGAEVAIDWRVRSTKWRLGLGALRGDARPHAFGANLSVKLPLD